MLGVILSKAAIRARLTGEGSPPNAHITKCIYHVREEERSLWGGDLDMYKSVIQVLSTEERNQKKTNASDLKETSFSFICQIRKEATQCLIKASELQSLDTPKTQGFTRSYKYNGLKDLTNHVRQIWLRTQALIEAFCLVL